MSENTDKRQVYITEATFRQITSKIELPKDFLFKDSYIWELSNGEVIGTDNPFIFNEIEIKDLLTYKTLCKDSDLFNITVFKKIQVQDSFRYIDAEKNPCYHIDKNCNALHSNYEFTSIKIPEVFLERYSAEDRKTKAKEYRDYFKTLLGEFNSKYGGEWMDNQEHKSQFAFRISLKFNIPDTIVFDRDEIGAKNSGVHTVSDDDIHYVKEEITAGFKSLWENDDRKKIWLEKKWLFRQSWLGNKKEDIKGNIAPYSQEEIKRILQDIHLIKRDRIIAHLKHLFYIQYCPDLKFAEETLKKLGLRPCWNCTRFEGDGQSGIINW